MLPTCKSKQHRRSGLVGFATHGSAKMHRGIGNKKNNVSVVYTPWSNLKKTSDMAVGQIGFHSNKEVKRYLIEKRENAVVNALNKTKVSQPPVNVTELDPIVVHLRYFFQLFRKRNTPI
eukprot:TRINITY_DN9162_c0_g1_i1.p1 TRINITY_DN9162_c0_g1~~TRINITY_DN9162_c0_g1_i1.p1  ORF type:complete len:119 (+),score=9.36 TRINITY_DN9162_c0_g1_i1:273-629(+)